MSRVRFKRAARLSLTLLGGALVAQANLRSARAGVHVDPQRRLRIEVTRLPDLTRLRPTSARRVEDVAVVRNLYGRLLDYDINGDLVPALASSMTWRDRALVLSFGPSRSAGRIGVTAETAARSLGRTISTFPARLRPYLDPFRAITVFADQLVLEPRPDADPVEMARALARTEFSIVAGYTGPYRPGRVEAARVELIAVADHPLFDAQMPAVVEVRRRTAGAGGVGSAGAGAMRRLWSLSFGAGGWRSRSRARHEGWAERLELSSRTQSDGAVAQPTRQFFSGEGAIEDRDVSLAVISTPEETRDFAIADGRPSAGEPRLVVTDPEATDLAALAHLYREGIIPISLAESRDGLAAMATARDPGERRRRLRTLHRALLDEGVIVPLALRPTVWFPDREWRWNEETRLAPVEFWKARRAEGTTW